MIQMMALADAADKENRIGSPASSLTPLATPKPTSKPKRKKSSYNYPATVVRMKPRVP